MNSTIRQTPKWSKQDLHLDDSTWHDLALLEYCEVMRDTGHCFMVRDDWNSYGAYVWKYCCETFGLAEEHPVSWSRLMRCVFADLLERAYADLE